MAGSRCCVVGCGNSGGQKKGLKFYRFPCATHYWKLDQRLKWIRAIKLNMDSTSWEPNNSSRVCSQHFIGGRKSNVATHPAYVPTIFPNSSDCLPEDSEEKMVIEDEDVLIPPTREFHTIEVQTDEIPLDEPPTDFNYFMCNRETFGFTSTAEVQVSLGPKKNENIDTQNKSSGFSGFSSINNDEKLNVLSGVTFAVFNLILKVLPKTKSMRISRENKLLIFLMKMKLGLTFASLAVIFDVHRTSVSRAFLSVLEALHIGLQDFVRWPSRHVVEYLLPEAFKKHYPKCRAIIDCSDIRIEHPSSIEQQVQTYSNYKSSQTVKFLIACTPDGYISFVSDCYGGRASDSFITVDSGFLDLIEPGDVILADKGFPAIRADIEKKNAIFVMPPFAFSEQFTQDEMSTTYEIASVRIHIERCIQRVKLFRITHFLPHELVPHCDKIVRICCALVNLQPPIIKSSGQSHP